MLGKRKSHGLYATKRLNHPESVRFLNNVKSLLKPSASGRTVQLAEMLGCDRRTAQRLLNAKSGENLRLRKAYVKTAAAVTGIPALMLIGRASEPTNIQVHMDRLISSISQMDRLKEMSTLASTMAARCMFGYDMPASFAVDCDEAHNPFSFRLMFRRKKQAGVLHQAAIWRDENRRWQLVYTHPKKGDVFWGELTDTNFERILTYVQNLEYEIKKQPDQRPLFSS